MRLEDYLKENGIDYQTETISGSKRIKTNKADITIYKDQIVVIGKTKSYCLPPTIRSYELLKEILK